MTAKTSLGQSRAFPTVMKDLKLEPIYYYIGYF